MPLPDSSPVSLIVPARFNGPPGSANGGWVSGRLAGFLIDGESGSESESEPQCVQVRLLRPPPLQAPMALALDRGAGVAEVSLQGAPVLQAQVCAAGELAPPPAAVDVETARTAEAGYRGLTRHPFPTCFACGPDRAPGDGLRLFPGPVPGRPGSSATTWTPAPGLNAEADPGSDGDTVPPEVCWAALDCPGAWTVDITGRPLVLGTMRAIILRPPAVGEACVVVGRLLGVERRKHWTATALYGGGGELLARASAVWIAIDATSP